jgi:hypothetical protein
MTGRVRLVRLGTVLTLDRSHVGLLILFLGLGLRPDGLASPAMMVVRGNIGLVRHIGVEGAALGAGLGSSWADDARDAARLVPGIRHRPVCA